MPGSMRYIPHCRPASVSAAGGTPATYPAADRGRWLTADPQLEDTSLRVSVASITSSAHQRADCTQKENA